MAVDYSHSKRYEAKAQVIAGDFKTCIKHDTCYCIPVYSYYFYFLQYKDAFLTANPNFRWYKLPAPPLRTLMTRPLTITKNTVPLSSPTSPLSSEFNPGKLADESQLGGLTSLMNNSYKSLPKRVDQNTLVEQKIIEKSDASLSLEVSNSRLNVPPKPLKKRFVELYEDDLKYSSRLFIETDTKDMRDDGQTDSGNLTNQDLMNKVSMCDLILNLHSTI